MGTFVKCFRDLAFDCYDEKDEETLMEICISNIVADYKVYLEYIGINQFSRLLEAMRKTSLSIKPSTGRSWKFDKNEAYHTLVSDRETYLPLTCSDKEFQVILDTMLEDGAMKLPRPYKTPSKEDRKDLRYYSYHQYVGHPSIVCQTLRKNLHAKIHKGTLELPCKT
ncbi:hypothetical protein D8674_017257 [Pyrus ussuriensis x Pyrus communis]|uniref:Uncharacterized protein n=1 Tax=Pyrus ussuriensis x Pyrus communis TaxID=2448454 RepID=A0A5N5HFB6_9ROSA|nr:hypothetical protein D8674_017257 [Pyrus ussuriensis x Pyrus communis]